MTLYCISPEGLVFEEAVPAFLKDLEWTYVGSSMTFNQVREKLSEKQWEALLSHLRRQVIKRVEDERALPEMRIYAEYGTTGMPMSLGEAMRLADLFEQHQDEVPIRFSRDGDRKRLYPVYVPGGGCVDFRLEEEL